MKYTVDSIFGCRIADGRRDRDGYVFWGRTRAHIVAWEQENGPVPDGLVLDHLCGVRACCAPHHSQPVTQSENLKRKNWRYRARIKTCPKGHDMEVNKVILPNKSRVCRTCNREAMRQ